MIKTTPVEILTAYLKGKRVRKDRRCKPIVVTKVGAKYDYGWCAFIIEGKDKDGYAGYIEVGIEQEIMIVKAKP